MVELEDFKYSGTNITALRLVNPESPIVQQVMPFPIHQKNFPHFDFFPMVRLIENKIKFTQVLDKIYKKKLYKSINLCTSVKQFIHKSFTSIIQVRSYKQAVSQYIIRIFLTYKKISHAFNIFLMLIYLGGSRMDPGGDLVQSSYPFWGQNYKGKKKCSPLIKK